MTKEEERVALEAEGFCHPDFSSIEDLVAAGYHRHHLAADREIAEGWYWVKFIPAKSGDLSKRDMHFVAVDRVDHG